MFLLLTLAISLILPTHTSGARNLHITQSNIKTTVCVKGYTATIRPSMSYTNALKDQQLKTWHYTDQNPTHYEEDHFIPLSLGGSPTSHNNLWPEPWAQADSTDDKEYSLYTKMCHGTITLKQAQQQIITYKKVNG